MREGQKSDAQRFIVNDGKIGFTVDAKAVNFLPSCILLCASAFSSPSSWAETLAPAAVNQRQ